VLQKFEKDNTSRQNNMVFNLISVRLMKIILKLINNFCSWDINTKNVDCGKILSYNDFKTVCLLFGFIVSTQKPNIYRIGSTADTQIKLLLDQLPANTYYIYCVIFQEGKVITEVIDRKLCFNV